MSRGVAASPLSDAELTRAAQAGDAGSLGVLLTRHEAAMRAVALGIIGYGPDTDDVVQDAALVAVRRITDVRNPAAVGPWLRAVVRNECRMRLRSRHVGDQGGEILSALPSEDPMPEEVNRPADAAGLGVACHREALAVAAGGGDAAVFQRCVLL